MTAKKKSRKKSSGPSTSRGAGASEPAAEAEPWFGLDTRNFAVLGAALVCIVAGYVLLDRGSVTAAPVLLTLGYVVLFPTGLLLGYRDRA
jgi:hypothetical protein